MFRLSTGCRRRRCRRGRSATSRWCCRCELCPKRIIDGCFPKYSLANYQGGYPCFSLGRNLYYSVVYAMQSQFPGYPEQLARGLSALAAAAPPPRLRRAARLPVERFVSLPLRLRFLRMLGRDATAPGP
jgi:hypothetical protein